VKNAIQSIPEERTPQIDVNVFSNDKEVIFTVSDNGNGVIEENISKVFEPKFTTKTSGMGLGLPMIKNIIEAYNGNITFNSQEHKGTTFKVAFPK
jgi:signal transduction histidine kinase